MKSQILTHFPFYRPNALEVDSGVNNPKVQSSWILGATPGKEEVGSANEKIIWRGQEEIRQGGIS
jgi:hypothetical protein